MFLDAHTRDCGVFDFMVDQASAQDGEDKEGEVSDHAPG
jgi:hypothetical protein